jgi:hypothetical protein
MEKKEVLIIVIAIILMSLIIILHEKSLNFLWITFVSALTVLVSVFCKKLTAKIIDIKIEHKIWVFQRWWVGKSSHLKNPVPAGVIIPAILSLVSTGFITCLSILQFESKALPGKAVKKYGAKRFSEIMEWDLCMIGFYGILGLLFLSIIAKILPSPQSGFNLILLSKYSFYYAIWNLLPISSLDGAKMFFGSSRLYIFTLILVLISGLIIFI